MGEPTVTGPRMPRGVPTPTQMTILQHVADGLTDQQIATRMQRTYRSVANEVSRLLRKLDATNRANLAAIALRKKWID